MKKAVLIFFIVCVASAAPLQPGPCQHVHRMATADSLSELSNLFFGDRSFGPAILLATNSRTGQSGFRFISDPNDLPAGGDACIPAMDEAERLRASYEDYVAAVSEMVLPKPGDISEDLTAIDSQKPVHVVSWIRADQLNGFKQQGTWIRAAPSDMWVTIVPKLKSFCQGFFKAHPGNIDQLTLRLEQRLGLPPISNKTIFLEITIEDPSRTDHLFRPCIDPSVNTTTCTLGPPTANTPEPHRNWIYQQYYSAFAIARPTQFPWTSLGYTFDWAPAESGRSRFEKFGESEFVIPKGAPIEILSATSAAEYCSPN